MHGNGQNSGSCTGGDVVFSGGRCAGSRNKARRVREAAAAWSPQTFGVSTRAVPSGRGIAERKTIAGRSRRYLNDGLRCRFTGPRRDGCGGTRPRLSRSVSIRSTRSGRTTSRSTRRRRCRDTPTVRSGESTCGRGPRPCRSTEGRRGGSLTLAANRLVIRTVKPSNLYGVRATTVVVLVEPDGSDNLSEPVLMNGLILFCCHLRFSLKKRFRLCVRQNSRTTKPTEKRV